MARQKAAGHDSNADTGRTYILGLYFLILLSSFRVYGLLLFSDYYACLFQLSDKVLCVSDFRQNLFSVLAEFRGRSSPGCRGLAEIPGPADHLHGARSRVLNVYHVVVCKGLWIVRYLNRCLNR